jgi:hypothetical protein
MPTGSANWNVAIDVRGRAGTVIYREGSELLKLHWEMGGGRALALIGGPPPQDWDHVVPWARGHERREEVMRRVADEAIRQQAPASTAEFGDDFCTILITMPRDAMQP